MNFRDLFRKATGHEPYPYQEGLVLEIELPQLLNIPTGGARQRRQSWAGCIGDAVLTTPSR